MKYALYILIISLNFNLTAQNWTKDTITLAGNVKQINYVREVFFEDDENHWVENELLKYNKDGFLLSSNRFGDVEGRYQNGIYRVFMDSSNFCISEYSIYDNDTTSKEDYSYNSFNRVFMSNYFSNNRYWNSSYYMYNNLGLLTEEITITARKDTLWDKYSYDNKTRLVEYIDSSKSSCIIKTWSYDSEDKLVEYKSEKLKSPKPIVVKMGLNGEILSEKKVNRLPKDDDHSIVLYFYDDLNQLKKESLTYIGSDEGYELIYEYNDHGDISIITNVNNKSGKEFKESIKYTYDQKGNWISKSYFWKRKLVEKETRLIEYYE